MILFHISTFSWRLRIAQQRSISNSLSIGFSYQRKRQHWWRRCWDIRKRVWYNWVKSKKNTCLDTWRWQVRGILLIVGESYFFLSILLGEIFTSSQTKKRVTKKRNRFNKSLIVCCINFFVRQLNVNWEKRQHHQILLSLQ